MSEEKKLTTAFGAPVPDNRNSATAGKRESCFDARRLVDGEIRSFCA